MKEYNCSFMERIGRCLFIVNVRPSDDAKKSLDSKIRDMIRQEVLSDALDLKSPLEGMNESDNLPAFGEQSCLKSKKEVIS